MTREAQLRLPVTASRPWSEQYNITLCLGLTAGRRVFLSNAAGVSSALQDTLTSFANTGHMLRAREQA
ncbi:hypothetical protein BgiBS90_023671, partial [Biomphalaria glabrata]